MAAALECWSSRTSTDTDDMVEQVLMRSNDRSEGSPPPASSGAVAVKEPSSAVQKQLQRLGRNVSEAIASLRNSLNIESARDSNPPSSAKNESSRKFVWGSVVRSLMQLYPGSQLPEKLVSNIRKHYDSLPLSYAQAGFDMKEVFLHIKLIEQASGGDSPATMIQETTSDAVQGPAFMVTFACNSSISWPVMSGSLDKASICCKKIQIFEKKGFTLGVVFLLVQPEQEKTFKTRVENALKLAMKKPKPTAVKLPFGLCGCQDEGGTILRDMGHVEEGIDEQSYRYDVNSPHQKIQLQMPLPDSSFIVSVDEWQTIQSGGDMIGNWLLSQDNLDFVDQIGVDLFKGVYKGIKVRIEKLKGCDKGNSYEFQLRKDLLELMTCGHRNILHFIGVYIDEIHGLCVVTKFMEGGAAQDLILKNKRLHFKEIMRIAIDVVEGLKFMNDHGVACKDLNTSRILLDRHGNACLGDMGIVSARKSLGEVMEYETDGYRWLAPEIIAGDPECVSETWMSNAYSFGMVIWEMVTGEAAYSAFSPVQAAVGIAACGLRPEIPKDCPQLLRNIMTKCWNSCPSKRPQFSEILAMLLQSSRDNRIR
ncbi:hypothetical protein SAY87_025383 [Trapa incisa]|uniref:Protein kinase domain-containing protein n=1 Tax=Trapa incisa TaxID=236973 RepID=A0AAN7GFS5_9MYRT|nr:hypothetical protein SAY87_025383 [Trapa incisa]